MFTIRRKEKLRLVVMLIAVIIVLVGVTQSLILAQEEGTSEFWPSPRIHPTMFFDSGTDHIVMFSGMTRMQRSIDLREVWTYNPESGLWDFMSDLEPVDALISFGFDEESRQIIALNNSPRQTWAFDLDSKEWEMREPSEQPFEVPQLGRRFGALFAYDSESDKLILFGGGAPGTLYADTWAYDYNTDTWENMNPSNSPSPRSMYQFVYDSESDRAILWGGFMEPDVDDILIWAYDYNSNTWESLENIDGPQTHWERHGMAYIPELDQILFFTGMKEYEDVLLEPETWFYDYNTNSWTFIETETSPPPMAMYSMVYDPAIGKVIIFGGELTSKYAGNTSNDIWLFDTATSNWSQVTLETGSQS